MFKRLCKEGRRQCFDYAAVERSRNSTTGQKAEGKNLNGAIKPPNSWPPVAEIMVGDVRTCSLARAGFSAKQYSN
ncbi:hypothetical protein CK516_34590 [Nostoc sp. 'Peltigera malacea cyanobiont' DB3992]|nr:hypothetical protein CK516_34590 [Nostoc sp. 'Peltigera malacea cyanobiont' DB3992]